MKKKIMPFRNLQFDHGVTGNERQLHGKLTITATKRGNITLIANVVFFMDETFVNGK